MEKPSFYDDVEGGILLLFNNQFDIADEFFLINKGVNPRAALHFSEGMVFRSIISEQATDREQAIERLQITIKLAEETIKSLENNQIPKGRSDITKESIPSHLLDAKVVLADSYTMLAGLQVFEEQRVKGLLNLRRAWKTYRQTLEKLNDSSVEPNVISSLKFGAGMFYFVISLIPPGLPQKAASLAGFKGGNKDLGLKYLRECSNSKSVRSDIAGLVLCLHHLFLTEELDQKTTKQYISEAEEIIKSGLEKYPKGSLFQGMSAVAHLEKGESEAAIVIAEAAIKNAEHITTNPAVCLRLLSNCYSLKMDWKKTSEILQIMIKKQTEQDSNKKNRSKNPWAITWNTLRLGACYIMLGENSKATKCFQEAQKAKSKDQWVTALIQQAQKFISTGGNFSMLEVLLLTRQYERILSNGNEEKLKQVLNLVEDIAKKSPGSLEPINKDKKGKDSLNDPKTDNRLAYLVLKGIILRYQQKKEEARASFMEVIAVEKILKDKLYYVIANMEMGRLVSKDSKEDATKYFQTAMKVNGFPWEGTLKTRIRNFMKQLGLEEEKDETDDAEAEKLLESEDLKELIQKEEEEL